MSEARILVGDVRERLRTLPDGSVRCVVTSPPYWGLRDYGQDGQLGLEQTPDEYVAGMVEVFREVRRVLSDDGTLWLNLGDSYASNPASGGSKSSGLNAKRNEDGTLHEDNKSQGITPQSSYKRPPGLKPKDLVGIPWRVAFALQTDGWYLRQDIIWAKPNPMPESVTDRCTKAHEYVFLLSKSPRYYYDWDAAHEMAVDGSSRRNRRSVWSVTTKPFKGAHFAVMPEALVEPCVLAGSAPGDTVLDPFSGSGTVGVVALRHGRNYVGCELNPEYAALSEQRISQDAPLMNIVNVEEA